MIDQLFSLKGKNALITGGTHGIGLAISEALGLAGARIFINGHDPERLENAVNIINQKNIEATGFLFDITDEKVRIRLIKVWAYLQKTLR